MTDGAILSHISRLPHARGNFKQLVRELGAKGSSRAELETALARLAARGDLIKLRSGNYVVTARSREFAVGRLNLHRDGYGFLISERPLENIQGDVFLPPEEAQKVADITANVRRKFAQGGTWQNRWPTQVDIYESEWARFKAA